MTTLREEIRAYTPAAGTLALWSLGQMGVLIKTSQGKVILIDPVLSNVVSDRTPEMRTEFSRAFPPPIQPGDIDFADLVFCTHEHMDHADPVTLGFILKSSPKAEVYTTRYARNLLVESGLPGERIHVPPLNEPVPVLGFNMTAIAAAHYEREVDPLLGARWLSVLFDFGRVTFFHSGDTLLHPGWLADLRTLPHADAAILAVNGRDPFRESKGVLGNLTPEEAVWLMKTLNWGILISGHNDLFRWNSLPEGLLEEAARRWAPEVHVCSLKPGERLIIRPQN